MNGLQHARDQTRPKIEDELDYVADYHEVVLSNVFIHGEQWEGLLPFARGRNSAMSGGDVFIYESLQ